MADGTDTPSGWDASWRGHRERQRQAWLDSTPAQRLAWLEAALRLAHRSGALPASHSPPADGDDEHR